jgi:hypothetical protein
MNLAGRRDDSLKVHVGKRSRPVVLGSRYAVLLNYSNKLCYATVGCDMDRCGHPDMAVAIRCL